MNKWYWFYFGFFTHLCTINLFMDWIGKEKYQEMVEKNWVNTQWWFWLVVFLVILSYGLGMTYVRRRRIYYLELLEKNYHVDNAVYSYKGNEYIVMYGKHMVKDIFSRKWMKCVRYAPLKVTNEPTVQYIRELYDFADKFKPVED